MRTALAPLLLTVALALSACSGASAGPEVDFPEEPAGVTALEAESVETPVDTIALALQEATGTSAEVTHVLDLGDAERADIIAHYDQALTERRWELREDAAISSSLGATWERDDHTLVLALLTLGGADVGIIVQAPVE